jgi:DNA-directed RNA polymerase specialized sigma24 family protein
MRKALLFLFLNVSDRIGMMLGFGTRRLKHFQNTATVHGAHEPGDAVVRAFSLGSEVAFKQIYDHYAPAIYRVVCRHFRSPVVAEALLLELFSAFWLKRAAYCEAAQLRLSLFTMARNLAIQYLGKVTAEALSAQRAKEEEHGTGPELLPVPEAARRQNSGCNIELRRLQP